MKHPLNSKWTLWFYKNESRNWEENQRQVVSQIMWQTKKISPYQIITKILNRKPNLMIMKYLN